ncbi:hypothetical protein LEMLEM_LOCUS24740, partial [Lemmus lemmus]
MSAIPTSTQWQLISGTWTLQSGSVINCELWGNRQSGNKEGDRRMSLRECGVQMQVHRTETTAWDRVKDVSQG